MMAKHAGTTFLKAIFLLSMLLGYGEAMAEWRGRIFDRLGPGQVSDTATITIGGLTQTININKTTPSAYTEFNCPTGQWPYSLQTKTGFYDQQGQFFFVIGEGSGTLNCEGNGDLEILGDYSVNPASLWLQNLQNHAVERQQESATSAPSRKPNCRLERKMTASFFNSTGNWSLEYVCD